MIKTALDIETGRILYLETTESGEDMTPAQEALDTMASQINTIKTDQGDLGDQVLGIQGDVNSLKQNAVLVTGEQTVDSKTFTKSTIKGSIHLIGDEVAGEEFSIDFLAGTAQIASNNGLDFLSKTNFVQTPTIEGDKNYDELAVDEMVSKKQVAQAIADVAGNHLDKWVIMGVPANVTLTETLQKMYMPATTRFPSLPPASMEPNADGTGIIFKQEGLVHIKRNVSLGGANIGNLYYEARINDVRIDELLAQAVSVSENTMNYSIEFYWYVTANQELSIWANSVDGNVPLNFKGVTTVVEYL